VLFLCVACAVLAFAVFETALGRLERAPSALAGPSLVMVGTALAFPPLWFAITLVYFVFA
jgi:hypothetical protein